MAIFLAAIDCNPFRMDDPVQLNGRLPRRPVLTNRSSHQLLGSRLSIYKSLCCYSRLPFPGQNALYSVRFSTARRLLLRA